MSTAKPKSAPKKTASVKKAPAAPKAEPKGKEINPAVLPAAGQQRWKKKMGLCLVKGCNKPADKGHFCSAHSAARSRLKAKGETLDQPIDFTPKPRGPKPSTDGAKAPAAKKAAPAKKSAGKPKKAPAPAPVEPVEAAAPTPETTEAPADNSLL